MLKLSIVITAYNVERYVAKCISSLLCQDCKDYELLIVDDGSTDSSADVINKMISESGIIRMVHQQNMGLSAARNRGLAEAKGEYVWFFDADDWAERESIPVILQALNDCDVLYFNARYIVRDGAVSIAENKYTECDGKSLVLKGAWCQAPFYIFRRDFLTANKLTFKVGIFHEDALFTPIALYRAKKVCPFQIPVYYQYAREGSITHTTTPKRCYDLMQVALELTEFAEKEMNIQERRLWGYYGSDILNSALSLSMHCGSKVQTDIDRFFWNNPEMYDVLCCAHKLPSRIMGRIGKLTRIPMTKLYRFLSRIKIIFGIR